MTNSSTQVVAPQHFTCRIWFATFMPRGRTITIGFMPATQAKAQATRLMNASNHERVVLLVNTPTGRVGHWRKQRGGKWHRIENAINETYSGSEDDGR